jgi:branched-chain amino acid aminotransferase
LRAVAVSERVIWVDGELVPWDRATVHVLAQSVQRGHLAFDLLPCVWLPSGPVGLGVREHAERFLRSVELAALRVKLDRAGVIEAIAATAGANPGATLIKISAYSAAVSNDLLPAEPFASVAVAAYSPEDLGGSSGPARPARLHVGPTIKTPPEVLSPHAKLAGSYTYAAIAKAQAMAEGFDDVLLLDREGMVAEGPTQSFFWVFGDQLGTAPEDRVLASITRRVVLEIAADEGVEVSFAPLPFERLLQADETFLASTTVGIRPVSQVAQRRFDPAPGLITARFMLRMQRLMRGEDPKLSQRWLENL